ncbi:NAD+ synthase [Streptosporangium sp. NBC_01755]|uniref:NAD+ synthase n=1 Tax=unclassified Streptosporangium TaxID=2632669 RepID=UPI002DD811D2|nr:MULTISPECIES: NAD+ synthase [unclassified Streptosporangium]WSA23038.1 NAD+ synthase [Streptosporangium sp. NBC_01810]WSC98818.1 NAD+ synthase [Streptosporangium sp. NBC_01755]
MAQLRIALAQSNPAVGDLAANTDRLVEWTRRAADRGAHLVVFTEMFLTGYPVEDLVLRTSFVEASISAIEEAARRLDEAGLGETPVVVGYVDRARLAPRVGQPKGAPLDAAALLHRGRVVVKTAKHHLPNYGVFDEYRYFVRGDRLPIFRLHGVDVAIAVCEDLWQEGGPVAVAAEAGAGLLVVPNASPYEKEKDDVRLALVARRAREAGCALAYVNQVGGQDELVFDGDSLIVSASGELIARAARFSEELLVTDLELPEARYGGLGEFQVDAGDNSVITVERLELSLRPLEPYEPEPPTISEHLDDTAEIYSALVLAVRDYVAKNGFGSVILGLSGGIDSALTATIASDALGPDRVHAVLMPSRYSSDHSLSDAQELVDRQGINARTVPIADIVSGFEKEIELSGLAAENLQARVRGMLLMSLSNQHGHLVLTTGNKSELATGYSTLYGDSAGGFAPIKDVLKTLVWELSRWRNAQAGRSGEFLHGFAVPPIPENSIEKEPSAELRPDQRDTDSLPEYEVLDRLLDDYVEKDMGSAELIAAGHDPALVARVIRLVDLAEYKRRQYPPGPKITPKNFGRDRRLPITNRWREKS